MINNLFRYIAFIFILFLSTNSYSQYYTIGQDPASIKWKKIRTEHFKIIYPVDFEVTAQKLSNYMEYMWLHDTKSLSKQPRIAPIVLHNQTIIPNAFTIWAPKRMEFYTCPSQGSYPEDWIKQLAIHEYRHFVQMDKLNQGFTKWLSILLGEQGTGITLGLYMPTWFMEGDAVSMETALSNSGRGRLPSFEMELRAQTLDNRVFSFDKATFGSYKDFIPDQYEIGYQIVAYARNKYGPDVWNKTFSTVAKNPFLITPFNKGLKQNTGLRKVKLYKKAIVYSDSLWRIQQGKSNYTAFTNITKNNNRNYWKYKFPAYFNDSIIFAERSGLDDISRFVAINKKTGKQKIIYTPGMYSTDNVMFVKDFTNKPGSLTADNISLDKGIIAWTEKEVDKRWDNRTYSVIKLYDIKKGKTRQLTKRSRYFAPAINADASKLAAIKVTSDNYFSIVMLDIKTGKELKQVIGSYKDFYITPYWYPDGKRILCVILNNNGKQIVSVNSETGKTTTILKAGFTDISNPKVYDKYIFYNAPYSGIDNIYALDTTDSRIYQVTSSKFGAYNISFSKSLNSNIQNPKSNLSTINEQLSTKIVYSDYSANGFDIVEADYVPSKWLAIENLKDNSIKLYKAIISQENGNIDTDTLNFSKTFKSKKYNKLLNLFNIHSWAPAYLDINNIDIKPGVSVLSQNLLSTLTTTAGYYYNTNENHGRYFADFNYAGLYPVFGIHFDYGLRSDKTNTGGGNPEILKYNYNETNLSLNASVPLNISNGKYFRLLQPSVSYGYKFQHLTADYTFSYNGNRYKLIFSHPETPYISYGIFAYNLLKTSSKDLAPKWGQVLNVNYSHDPFNNNADQSNIFASSLKLYFPGFINHHSINLYAAYQKKNADYVNYSDVIRLPYGFSDIDQKDISMISFAYRLPLLYPDLSLGSLAYIKRISGGLFYDYSAFSGIHYSTNNEQLTTNNNIYRSTGVEMNIDLHILRFIAPINLGLRAIYSPDYKTVGIDKISFQFLYAINVRDL